MRLQQIVQIVIMRSSNDQTTKTDEISFLSRGNGLSFGDEENSSDFQRDVLLLHVKAGRRLIDLKGAFHWRSLGISKHEVIQEKTQGSLK